MESVQSINLISTDPDVRGGRPVIAGTSLEVSVIAITKILHGQSAEDIAADYDLSLPQVYAALAYYYSQKDEIDATIQERRKLAQKMKEQRVGSRHPSPKDMTSVLADLQDLSAEISANWPDGVSAAEAVCDVRRDL